MHCPACGVEVAEQAVYCHKCGHRIVEADGEYSDGSPERGDRYSGEPNDARDQLERSTSRRRRDADNDQEEEIWEGRYSPKAMIGAWILTALLTLALLIGAVLYSQKWVWITVAVLILLAWLYQGGKLAYRRLSVSYRLTDQRLIHETGILRRVTDRIETIDMDDITYSQTFVDRLTGVGTVIISSTDRTHPELRLIGIENVKDVADRMDDVRRAERRRRGLHIESI